MQKKLSRKTSFASEAIRKLTNNEEFIFKQIDLVIRGDLERIEISRTEGFVSQDGKERPLIFSSLIAQKIIRDHGSFSLENLIINALEWEYVICNVDKNPDKINLIKKIPNTDTYLTIGANRDNGFFLVTHYEAIAKDSEKLKNLLRNKGDALDRSGRAVVPSFATSP